MMKTILITNKWCVINKNFNFKKEIPAIYFYKKDAQLAKDTYYPNKLGVKICKVKILIS